MAVWVVFVVLVIPVVLVKATQLPTFVLRKHRVDLWKTQRALRLKKFNPDWSREIFKPYDWKFQSRIENSPQREPYFQSRMKCSVSIENFNLRLVAWKFQSRSEILNFFNLWALWEVEFGTGTRWKAFFEFFSAWFWTPPPPRYIWLYSEKRQIWNSLVPAIFSPIAWPF